MLYELILAALGSGAVGLFIGWCGVAGFLLPILFTGACGLSVTESLLLSFRDFTSFASSFPPLWQVKTL
nr:hypothetical protein [uncultured Oscillibacter sp.]